MQAVPRHVDPQNWISLLFLGILLLIIFVKITRAHEFYDFKRILSSNKYFTENERSPKVLGLFGFLLFFVQMLILALGGYFLILRLDAELHPTFELFVKVFLILSVFIASKYFIEMIVGTVFSINKLLDHYIFFKITFKNFLALCLFPVLVILAYTWDPPLIIYKFTTLIFICLNGLVLVHFYRKKHNLITANLFYFILYLCTLEIAPYYFLYKVIA